MVKLICRTLNSLQLWSETVKAGLQYNMNNLQVSAGHTSILGRGPLLFCFVSLF